MEDEKHFEDEPLFAPPEDEAEGERLILNLGRQGETPKTTADKAKDEEARKKRISESDFQRADWRLAEALHWGAYRDPTGFRALHRDELRRIALYAGSGLADPQCHKTLRKAFINGDITAVRNGAAVSKNYWVGRSVWAWDFNNIWLMRIDVLKLWPPIKKLPAKAEAKAQCREWLKELRKRPKLKNKAEYKTEAENRFGVGPDQFRTAWDEAAEEAPNPDWSKPGRRKKSSGFDSSGQ